MQNNPDSTAFDSGMDWDSVARSEWPNGPADPLNALAFNLGSARVYPWYGFKKEARSILLNRNSQPGQTRAGWLNIVSVSAKNAEEANAQALRQLNAGATGILFCGITDETSPNALLAGIQAQYCWTGFSGRRFSKSFLTELSVRLQSESCERSHILGALYADPEEIRSNLHAYDSLYRLFPGFHSAGVEISTDLTCVQALTFARSWLNDGRNLASLAFHIPLGIDFFDSIITIRAFRLACFILNSSQDNMPFISGYFDSRANIYPEPGGNMAAAAMAGLSGILGGLDGICFPYTLEKDYYTRNISLLLSEEAHLDKVVDPLCGSWCIEELSMKRAVEMLHAIAFATPEESLKTLVENQLVKSQVNDVVWKTREGINVQSFFPDPVATGFSPESMVPGVYPFLRGPYATMYSRRPWTIRQYAGFSSAEESNRFYRTNLAAGQTGLSIAFDLPTHRGYDSDHPRVQGDVGKAGVAIDTVEDMKLLLDEIPLDRISVSMTMNGAVLPIMAFFLVTAEEQGVDYRNLTGTLQNDILKEFMVRNTYIYPPEPSMRIVTDVMEYCASHLPRFNSISVSGYHMHEAGASADLEMAYTIADGLEYLRLAVDRGLSVDSVAPRISFFWGIGMNFFMELAKMRAARLVWAEQVRVFKPQDPRSCMLRVHCQTSGWSLTAQDPENNVSRTAVEAVAAVLGGTQSLHTNALDEALALPSDYAAAVARNTQIFLQKYSGIPRVTDAFGGSHYLEYLTGELVRKTRTILDEIKHAGGMTSYVSSGVPKLNIARCAAERQARIDAGEEIIIGVNRYVSGEAAQLSLRSIDQEEVRKGQESKLNDVRSRRDERVVRSALENLESGARTGRNLLELSIEAARCRCTLGEISLALERVFGRYITQTMPMAGVYSSSMSDTESVRRVQEQSNLFAAATGRRPRILVAKIGQDGHDRGAQVVASAFADFGFDVDIGPLFSTPAEVARQALDNDVHVVGISTLAGGHNRLIPELLFELHRESSGHKIVVVAGGVIPEVDYANLHEAGVHLIFGPGTNLAKAASSILNELTLQSAERKFEN